MDSFEVMAEILGLRKVYFLVDSDLIENLKRFERTDNPEALSLFTVIWTAGMAAMMFPAISPMVLLYDRMIKNKSNNEASSSKKGEAKEGLASEVMSSHQVDNPVNWDAIIKSHKGVITSDNKRTGTVIAQTEDDIVIF